MSIQKIVLPRDLEWLPSTYRRALEEFLTKVEPLLNEIECIAIVGSTARKEDFVESWSDIDILVVVRKRELIDAIKKIADEVNARYFSTGKGSGIISLWIDDSENVYRWLGLGCEYYNIVKNFVLIYGRDIRENLREPTREDIVMSVKVFLREVERYIKQIDRDIVKYVDTLSIARLLYPLLRFYLCIEGYPTASRVEMLRILREAPIGLDEEDRELLVVVLRDLIENRKRVDPKLNEKVFNVVDKLLQRLASIDVHNYS